ncbi:MAG: sensor histidine kinase N-terminal domain-containing protein [Burkholderiales bacterium]
MSEPRFTLRGKLLRWLLVPLLPLFLLDAAASYFIATGLSGRVYDGELTEIARELTLHIRRDGDGLEFDLTSEAERTLLLDQYDKVYFAVRAPDGAVLAGDAALPQPQADAGAAVAFYDSSFGGEKIRVSLMRTTAGAVVLIAETLVKRHALAEEIFFGAILPQLLLILIAALLVWVGVAHGLAPLRRLQGAVAARSHLDLSPVMAEGVPGEVHPLLLAINDLMTRLSEVLNFQGRFIADATHQLRTPVAGLKAHIEVALREDDLDQIRRSLAHLYTGVERLSRLVSQLLSLARNEPNTIKTLNFAPLDLNKLAFDVTMEWVPEAYKKNIDLGFESADGPVMISGDATRLAELVNNLLDNAIRYSRNQGRVTVRVARRDKPHVSISDDGPTIPVEERQRVFERFHRLLGSHADGSGLGLAIVREIATLHGAEIALEDDIDGVGNTFTVSFPEFRPG